MSHHDLTDLEPRLAAWRRSMLSHDEILRDDLEELEAHLRAGIAGHVDDGMPEAEAVTRAMRDLGEPAAIAAECAKEDPNRVWRRRLRRMLVGPLVGRVVAVLAPGVARLPFVAGGLYAVGPHGPTRLYASLVALCLLAPLAVAVALPGRALRMERDALAAAWRRLGSRYMARVAVALGALLVAVLSRTGPWGVGRLVRHVGGRGLSELAFGNGPDHIWYYTYPAIIAPPALMVAILWMAHRERAHECAGWRRDYDPLWSRRVRWVMLGQALLLMAPSADNLGRIAAVQAWRARGSMAEISAAQGAPYVAALLALGLVGGALGMRRELPLLRRADRVLRWMSLGSVGSAAAMLCLYALCVYAQRLVYAVASTAFDVTRYGGAHMVEAAWRQAWGIGYPVVAIAVIAWLLLREKVPAAHPSRRRGIAPGVHA